MLGPLYKSGAEYFSFPLLQDKFYSLLCGPQQIKQAPIRNSWKAYSRETTPDGLRSKSASSKGRSPSPASNASSSNWKSPTNYLQSSPIPTVKKLFPESPHHGTPGKDPKSLHEVLQKQYTDSISSF